MKKINLHNGKELPLHRKHPWVFSGAIKSMEGEIEDGEIVSVFAANKKFLGIGHYQKSSISVRVFSFTEVEIDEQFWFDKIKKAFDYRVTIGVANSKSTNAYRLVFGESDGLPGLIIDFYDGNAVFQAHSIGMHLIRNEITDALKKVYGKNLKTVYDKSKESLPGEYGSGMKNGFLFGENENCVITENGNKFLVDWVNGQKTGFFLDQRESRKLLGEYSKGKKVLNTFCYTGGFSVYAGNAGATLVHSTDSSKRAIELTEKNAELNELKNHTSFCEDTFDFLEDSTEDYDIVILDPPAFAKHREAKHNAVKGYKRLNALAMKKIKPGGIIFTFSCTQVVDKTLFFNTVTSAAIEAGREIKILHYLNQPADHPINPLHQESEYLKGLVVYVA
ncbi:MAG: class I SAM-dependent rRNA methyltransferase [Bacteroidia bacterium]|nr:class I SAM-dependent rRNA methyltransferase [Bacteroidia bacterium]